MADGRVALLRGVNLGSTNKVSVAELKMLAKALGFTDPRTVVNSGNLVFRDARGTAALAELIEAEVAARTGVRCAVLVRTEADWRDLLAANPFPEAATRNPSQLLVTVLSKPADAQQIAALRAFATIERIEAIGRAIYTDFAGALAASRLGNALMAKRGPDGTSRNWNTVQKIAALLAG